MVKSYRFEPVGGAPNKSKKHSKLEVSHEVNFHMVTMATTPFGHTCDSLSSLPLGISVERILLQETVLGSVYHHNTTQVWTSWY